MLKVAILDDYQNVAQQFVDLEKLSGKYEFKIFSEPFLDEADAIEKLADFQALLIMRERTPITKNLIDNLNDLKFIITSGLRNKSIDLEAAKKRKVIVCGTDINLNPTPELTWALYSTLLKGKKYELSQISLLQVVITFGLVFLIPIYFIEYQIGFRIYLELPFILILSYVVLFPGLASFILWIKGISMIGANRSGVFLHLMPILSAIMAMIFFNEKFMFYHILGACFIITGILLSNKKVKNA